MEIGSNSTKLLHTSPANQQFPRSISTIHRAETVLKHCVTWNLHADAFNLGLSFWCRKHQEREEEGGRAVIVGRRSPPGAPNGEVHLGLLLERENSRYALYYNGLT